MELSSVWLIVAAVTVHLMDPSYAIFTCSDASALEDALLSGYHTMVRPSLTTDIHVEYGMYHITALDNVEQKLSVVGFLLVRWQDDRLSWTPSDFGGMSDTYLRADQIWVPPLALANSADDLDILSDDADTKSVPIYISFTGSVIWLAAASFNVACTVDISYYPFDEQVCEIQIAAWMYSEINVNLTIPVTFVNLELYEQNGEWDVEETDASEGTRTMHGHTMSQVIFSIHLNRKHSYYILNIILPVVFISFLGCLVFLLPVESGEKNGFALTILLSLTVVLTIVSDKLPTTSEHLCILSVYLLCAVMISALEVLMTVIIQRIHARTQHGYKLTRRMKGLTSVLAKITCYKITQPSNQTTKDSDKISLITLNGSKGSNKISPKNELSTNDITKDKINYEYEDFANVIDKIFFFLFFFITVIVTLTFQLILSSGE